MPTSDAPVLHLINLHPHRHLHLQCSVLRCYKPTSVLLAPFLGPPGSIPTCPVLNASSYPAPTCPTSNPVRSFARCFSGLLQQFVSFPPPSQHLSIGVPSPRTTLAMSHTLTHVHTRPFLQQSDSPPTNILVRVPPSACACLIVPAMDVQKLQEGWQSVLRPCLPGQGAEKPLHGGFAWCWRSASHLTVVVRAIWIPSSQPGRPRR